MSVMEERPKPSNGSPIGGMGAEPPVRVWTVGSGGCMLEACSLNP